ncbi:hypothetical protein NUBL21974_48210 [Klebsiella quasipneumoniae]|nr:hypothetical protein NUBL21974_48210 [Klebsiella quasipneumoniae]
MFYKKQISIKKEPDGPSMLGQLKPNPFINKDMLTRGSVQTFLRGSRQKADSAASPDPYYNS